MLAMGEKVGRTDVNPVPMTEVRPRLTEIVDNARDHGIATALTEYGRPRAFVVSVPFFERAERDAALVQRLGERDPDLLAELSGDIKAISVPLRMAKD